VFESFVEDGAKKRVEFDGGLGFHAIHGFQPLIFKMRPNKIS
jgi:hypothetical protein